MFSKAEPRFVTDIESLRKFIASAKLKKPEVIQRRERYYPVEYAAEKGLTAQRDKDKHAQAEEGFCALKSTLGLRLSPADVGA